MPEPASLGAEQAELIKAYAKLRPIHNLKALELYGLAVLIGWAILHYPSWYIRIPGYFAMACIFAGIGVLLHDGAHGLLFKNRLLNQVMAQILAGSLGLAFTQFKYAHLFHHRHTNNSADRDRLFYLRNIPYMILFGGRALYLSTVAGLKTASRRFVIAYFVEIGLVLVALGSLLALLSANGLLLAFVHVYLIPYLLFSMLLIARLLLEHYECDPDDDFRMSRTFKSNLLVRWLWSNVNYHVIHHFWPAIPWYNLKKTYDLIEPYLRENGAYVESGYLCVLMRALRKHGFRRPPYWSFPERSTVVRKRKRPSLLVRPSSGG
jgi:fatty acid desaturase